MDPVAAAGPRVHLRALVLFAALIASALLFSPAAHAASHTAKTAPASSAHVKRAVLAARTAAVKRTLLVRQRRVAQLHRHNVRACRQHGAGRCLRAKEAWNRAEVARLRKVLNGLAPGKKKAVAKKTAVKATGKSTGTVQAAAAAKSAAVAAPAQAAATAVSASVRAAGFQPGIVAGSAPLWELPKIKKLGAHLARVEFSIGSSPDDLAPVIGGLADAGVRVLPLAGFARRIPSTAEAQNLASWAAAFGPGGSFWRGRGGDDSLAIQSIEFGNETSYQYQGVWDRGGDYARRFVDAQTAIAGVNPSVGLLAIGDDQDGHWFDQMFSAVPNLGAYVAGWTIHPYGTARSTDSVGRTLLAKTAQYGAPSDIPVDVTEWGVASDNGNCLDDNYGLDTCMSGDAATGAMNTKLAQLRGLFGTRLRSFLVYRVMDLTGPGANNARENYFGALRSDGSDKGVYTDAVKSLLAS